MSDSFYDGTQSQLALAAGTRPCHRPQNAEPSIPARCRSLRYDDHANQCDWLPRHQWALQCNDSPLRSVIDELLLHDILHNYYDQRLHLVLLRSGLPDLTQRVLTVLPGEQVLQRVPSNHAHHILRLFDSRCIYLFLSVQSVQGQRLRTARGWLGYRRGTKLRE